MAELVSWQMALIPLLLEGTAVTLLDADEKHNRVRIGVRDLVMASEVEEEAADLGVAAQALLFVERGSPEPFSAPSGNTSGLVGDVTDRIRPTLPGTQITPEDLTPCTMGFNVYTSNGSRYFLTASHCT